MVAAETKDMEEEDGASAKYSKTQYERKLEYERRGVIRRVDKDLKSVPQLYTSPASPIIVCMFAEDADKQTM
jgi:hypothetical protein